MNLIFYIGAFDAVAIAALGATAATLILLGKQPDVFYERIVPAVGMLVATSFAAGVVMAITRWLFGG